MADESRKPRVNGVVRLIPWAVLVLVLAITAASLLLFPPVATSARNLPAYLAYGLNLAWSPVCALIGALVTSHRRDNRIGWLLVGLGFLVSILLFAAGAGDSGHPAADAFNILSDTLWLLWISLFAMLILLFPDGRPLSPRWRLVVWFAALWPSSALLLVVVLAPQDLTEAPTGLAQIVMTALLVVTVVAISASAVLRFARSRGTERQQLKWFAYLTTLGLATLIAADLFPGWGSVLAALGLFGPLAGIAVAVFRHRLYDIDVLIGRTFVYGALVAILAGLYSASIRLFNALFVGVTGLGSEEVLVITTLVLAASFTPLKKWLEEIVERRFKKPAELAAASPEALADPAAFASIEGRLRAIVRDELERSGRAG